MVANLQETVDVAMLKQLLYGHLKQSTVLAYDIAFYDRQDWTGRSQEAYDTLLGYTVSYTHLTLPTICSV
eukprot:6608997-Alexandrium_andersonii.AAC.1